MLVTVIVGDIRIHMVQDVLFISPALVQRRWVLLTVHFAVFHAYVRDKPKKITV
jgi:hypothetical protein